MTGRLTIRVKRWFGYTFLSILALSTVVVAMLLLLASRVKLAGEEITPSGIRRNTSQYVAMRDRTRIAVDIWLPADYHAGERLPVLLRCTRSGRAVQPRLQLRLRVLLHLQAPDALFGAQDQYFSQRRFVLVLSDMRGSGASEGDLLTQYSQDGIADLGDVATWVSTQPWSNGRIGSYGMSFGGDTAEMAVASGNPAIRAEAPMFDDFDTMQGFANPGGVYDRPTIEHWSGWLYSLDRNDLCALASATGWRCWLRRLLVGGVKHTDDDANGRQLAVILAHRNNPPVDRSLSSRVFRDDMFMSDIGPLDLRQTEPYEMRHQIESTHVPILAWCGWMDAGTADGALNRYRNFSNPQVVRLGAFTHGGGHGTDPLLGNFDPPNPPEKEGWRIEADYFDSLLRLQPPAKVVSRIDYYTMGEGRWHTTTTWPPEGLKSQRFYFAADHRLGAHAPGNESASDPYSVDFSATTGRHSRWLTQLGGGYVNYGNRAGEDAKLLTYTGDPMPADTEITGSPVVTMELASSTPDGAVHAYLEDVAPDGRVTYLTEGVLRLINRNTTTGQLPYEPLGPRRSYLRSDAAPMEPGQPERVELGLLATSVLLRKGHRIRFALAGADRDNFEPISADKQVLWTVYRDQKQPSFIDLPMKLH